MNVKKQQLLLTAGIVWLIGGAMVLRIGIQAATQGYNLWSALVTLGVYLIFHLFIFGPLVKRHTVRIMAYEQPKVFILYFFDVKSWAIMIFMMSMGIALRSFHILPLWWIAAVYIGIGSALAIAGVNFTLNYIRVLRDGAHKGAGTATE